MMTLFSSQPGDEGLPGPARARVMAAIMTTTLMGVFDGTMINIALPSMAQEMQVPASIAVWFANGYLLAAAMTLAIFAALAARLGYRPVFLAGLTTFTLTSLGCALANTPEVLIGMRVLQGIGGAATLSIAPAILRSVFPGRFEGGKRSAIHKLFAKGFQQHTEIHANQQARRQPRHHDNQQRVETQCKTNNHHRNPDKWQQCRTVHKRYPIQSERCAPTAIFYTSQQSEAGALRRAMLCFASGSTEPALKSYI